MKPVIVILSLPILLACDGLVDWEKCSSVKKMQQSSITPVKEDLSKLFGKNEATRILGESAKQLDNTHSKSTKAHIWQSSYEGENPAEKGKLGVVYYMIEEYDMVSDAINEYASIKKANEKNGITDRSSVGYEAYFHTDNTNFYFVLLRKGTKMFRIKVNKITPKTSVKEFDKVTEEIASRL